jgi:hypothetical protein
LKLQTYLSRLISASNEREQVAATALSREQVSRIWDFVDQRDDYVAQYVQLLDSGLRGIAQQYSAPKARSLMDVVTKLLDKHLDYESRRDSRLAMMRSGLFEAPEPDAAHGMLFSIMDEEDDDAEGG